MKLIVFVISIILVITFFPLAGSAEEEKIEFTVSKPEGHVMPGQLIIEVKKGVIDIGKESGVVAAADVKINSESLASLNKQHGLESVERLFSGTRKDNPSDIYVFRFSTKVNIDTIISDYKKEEGIFYAEPNYVASLK